MSARCATLELNCRIFAGRRIELSEEEGGTFLDAEKRLAKLEVLNELEKRIDKRQGKYVDMVGNTNVFPELKDDIFHAIRELDWVLAEIEKMMKKE